MFIKFGGAPFIKNYRGFGVYSTVGGGGILPPADEKIRGASDLLIDGSLRGCYALDVPRDEKTKNKEKRKK